MTATAPRSPPPGRRAPYPSHLPIPSSQTPLGLLQRHAYDPWQVSPIPSRAPLGQPQRHAHSRLAGAAHEYLHPLRLPAAPRLWRARHGSARHHAAGMQRACGLPRRAALPARSMTRSTAALPRSRPCRPGSVTAPPRRTGSGGRAWAPCVRTERRACLTGAPLHVMLCAASCAGAECRRASGARGGRSGRSTPTRSPACTTPPSPRRGSARCLLDRGYHLLSGISGQARPCR
jgi:hypothetical protein